MPIVCSEDFVSLYSTLNLTAMRTRILCLVWIGIAALVGCGGKGMRSGLSSDTFAIRSDSVYSREELSQLLSTLYQRLYAFENQRVYQKVERYDTAGGRLNIHLVVNLPKHQKEFRERILDSPALRFLGPVGGTLYTKEGVNDTLGISLVPEKDCCPISVDKVRFILRNDSEDKCVHLESDYPIAYEQDGKWYALPQPAHISVADQRPALLQPGESRILYGYLHPELYPTKPGRYRFFKSVWVEPVGEYGKYILLMAEFRLE